MGRLNTDECAICVDDDPTQIVDVITVVEKEGTKARLGTDINISDFVYQSGTSIVMSDLGDIEDITDLIDREIERVGAMSDKRDRRHKE
ncbi:hypothetical protein RKD55_004684 [Rossellomorea marisflavi]